MRYNQDGKTPVSPLMCDFSDTKSSLKMRFANIFEDSKKKKGIISLIIILIIIGLIGSFFVFGKKEVEQVNDKLTIYTRGFEEVKVDGASGFIYREGYTYDKVVADFKLLYPDVEVEVVELNELSDEAYSDKINADLLAGNGPDVIMFDNDIMQIKDVNKIIASGVLAPMDEFLAADETFKQEDYYQGILKSGMYRGKRYAMPVRFAFPVFITGENALKATGINQAECQSDYISLFKQCAEFANANIDDPKTKLFYEDGNTYSPLNFLNYTGANPTKENKNIDTPEFRSIVESIKAIKNYQPENTPKSASLNDFIPPSKLIEKGEVTFYDTFQPNLSLDMFGIPAIKMFDTPLLLTFKKPNGNIDAIITDVAMINAKSANKQNAYNYIKLLMSYKNNSYYMGTGLSSNRTYTETAISIISTSDVDNEMYDLKAKALNDNERNMFTEIINSVDNANFVTPIVEIIKTELQPFFEDKMTYEECIKQAQTKVDLYFAE